MILKKCCICQTLDTIPKMNLKCAHASSEIRMKRLLYNFFTMFWFLGPYKVYCILSDTHISKASKWSTWSKSLLKKPVTQSTKQPSVICLITLASKMPFIILKAFRLWFTSLFAVKSLLIFIKQTLIINTVYIINNNISRWTCRPTELKQLTFIYFVFKSCSKVSIR